MVDGQADRIRELLDEADERSGPVPEALLEEARALWWPMRGREIAERLRGRGDIDLTTDEVMDLTRGEVTGRSDLV